MGKVHGSGAPATERLDGKGDENATLPGDFVGIFGSFLAFRGKGNAKCPLGNACVGGSKRATDGDVDVAGNVASVNQTVRVAVVAKGDVHGLDGGGRTETSAYCSEALINMIVPGSGVHVPNRTMENVERIVSKR